LPMKFWSWDCNMKSLALELRFVFDFRTLGFNQGEPPRSSYLPLGKRVRSPLGRPCMGKLCQRAGILVYLDLLIVKEDGLILASPCLLFVDTSMESQANVVALLWSNWEPFGKPSHPRSICESSKTWEQHSQSLPPQSLGSFLDPWRFTVHGQSSTKKSSGLVNGSSMTSRICRICSVRPPTWSIRDFLMLMSNKQRLAHKPSSSGGEAQ